MSWILSSASLSMYCHHISCFPIHVYCTPIEHTPATFTASSSQPANITFPSQRALHSLYSAIPPLHHPLQPRTRRPYRREASFTARQVQTGPLEPSATPRLDLFRQVASYLQPAGQPAATAARRLAAAAAGVEPGATWAAIRLILGCWWERGRGDGDEGDG